VAPLASAWVLPCSHDGDVARQALGPLAHGGHVDVVRGSGGALRRHRQGRVRGCAGRAVRCFNLRKIFNLFMNLDVLYIHGIAFGRPLNKPETETDGGRMPAMTGLYGTCMAHRGKRKTTAAKRILA
jgi:hypothetical protein